MAKNFKTFFIVNPMAGHGCGRDIWKKAKGEIKDNLGSADFAYTDSQGHAIVLATEAIKGGYEMIVAVGGDGTVNEVINGFFNNGRIVNEEAVLGILAAGTGGDLSRYLKFPKKLSERIFRLKGGGTRWIDIGFVSYRSWDDKDFSRYFINVSGCGLSGDLVGKISRMPRTFGPTVAYLAGLVESLYGYKGKNLEISIDGAQPIERKALCAVVANGRYFGGGMHIAPGAKIDDGLFDFVIMGDIGILRLLCNLPGLYWGDIRNNPRIEYYQAKKVKISSAEDVLIDMDGEQEGRLPATFTVIPMALRLKV